MRNHKQPIFIASKPRSGSSLTSHILHEHGVFGGIMKPADGNNARGYFENIQITSLLIEYLRRNDIENKLKKYNPKDLKSMMVEFDFFVNQILTEEGLKEGENWFFKDPKIAFCWNMMHRSFPEAKWIIVKRDESQVLNSIIKTDFMDAYNTTQDWIDYLNVYNHNLEQLEKKCNPFILNINKVFNNDLTELRSMFDFIGVKLNENIVDKCVEKKLWNAKT